MCPRTTEVAEAASLSGEARRSRYRGRGGRVRGARDRRRTGWRHLLPSDLDEPVTGATSDLRDDVDRAGDGEPGAAAATTTAEVGSVGALTATTAEVSAAAAAAAGGEGHTPFTAHAAEPVPACDGARPGAAGPGTGVGAGLAGFAISDTAGIATRNATPTAAGAALRRDLEGGPAAAAACCGDETVCPSPDVGPATTATRSREDSTTVPTAGVTPGAAASSGATVLTVRAPTPDIDLERLARGHCDCRRGRPAATTDSRNSVACRRSGTTLGPMHGRRHLGHARRNAPSVGAARRKDHRREHGPAPGTGGGSDTCDCTDHENRECDPAHGTPPRIG